MELVNLLSLMLCCVISSLTAQSPGFHEDWGFNCQSPPDSNTIFVYNMEGKIRSLSLFSPCHPEDYYWGCFRVEICYIQIHNIPRNAWIGLYMDEEYLVPESSTDILWIKIDELSPREELTKLQPGLFYRYSQLLTDDTMSVALARPEMPSGSPDDIDYRFQVDVKFAYVMGRHNNVSAKDGGYIVSHENFDEGKDTNNYTEDKTVQLTLNGLSNNNILRLNFLTFHLRYSQLHCDDYLVVRGVRGYLWSETIFCGDEARDSVDLYPESNEVTFTFVSSWTPEPETSAGFLINYEVIQWEGDGRCPPHVENTNRATLQQGSSQTYTIYCMYGYWLSTGASVQTIDCSTSDWMSTILPCISIRSATTCPPDIPNSKPAVQITATSKHNIECETGYWTTHQLTSQIIDCINDIWRTTMSPCISEVETTNEKTTSITKEEGTNEKTTSAAEAETTNEKTTSQPMTDTEEQVDEKSDQLPAYIGGGVGVLVLVVLIVLLVLFLVRRRQNRNTESRKRALSPQSTPSLTADNDTDRNNRGDIYYLADEDEINSDNRLPQHQATTSTEVYELAELEDTYENSLAIDRFECEKDISQDYAPVLAVSKTKKTPDEGVDIMIENDLYGT